MICSCCVFWVSHHKSSLFLLWFWFVPFWVIVCLVKIIFANLFYYSSYFCYYSWVPLHFLKLFTSLTILFQLTFTFIYSIFSKSFQFQQNKRIPNGPLIIRLFESEDLILYQSTIYMAMYLNVPINYLSNINCNYVINFDYHDNLLKRMRIWKQKTFTLIQYF